MTTESKEKSLPGYKSLAEVQRETLAVAKDQLAETKTGNKELVKINKYKEEQKQGDITYRKYDMRMKKQSTYLNVFGLLMAGVALAISITANGITPMVEMFMGMFL